MHNRHSVTTQSEENQAATEDIPAPLSAENFTVLIVEDNAVNQLVTEELVHSLGFEVVVADNGVTALEALTVGGIDLVLMDCQMPVMDGFQATRELRKREAASGALRLPIIALTANAVKGDRELCLAAGMDDYLSKPVDPHLLEIILLEYLGGLNGHSQATGT